MDAASILELVEAGTKRAAVMAPLLGVFDLASSRHDSKVVPSLGHAEHEAVTQSSEAEHQQKLAQLREMAAQVEEQIAAARRRVALRAEITASNSTIPANHLGTAQHTSVGGLQHQPEPEPEPEPELEPEPENEPKSAPTVLSEGVPPLTIEEVNTQMDNLADYLRAKMVRLEAEQPERIDVYNRAPQLMSDLVQLYSDLALLADLIGDGSEERTDPEEQTADGINSQDAASRPMASDLPDLQLFEDAFAYASSQLAARRSPRPVEAPAADSPGQGVGMTWTVEVDLSSHPEHSSELEPRDDECIAWAPEVGWDEDAACAWVREWDEQTATWRYTNLDTQQETWSYPHGVERFEPVGPDIQLDCSDDTDDICKLLQENSELEAAIDALEQRLATFTAAQAGASVPHSVSTVESATSVGAAHSTVALGSNEHGDSKTSGLQTAVVSALADADTRGDPGHRPSEEVLQLAEKEFRARLSAAGRQQMEETVTAKIREQLEISIAELSSQSGESS